MYNLILGERGRQRGREKKENSPAVVSFERKGKERKD